MINKTQVVWSLIALAIISPLLGAWYLHMRHDNFSCQIQTTIVDDDSVIDVIMNYTFKEGAGIYESAGEYREEGSAPVPISNKITFNYWNESGQTIMVSDDTNVLPKKLEGYRGHIPDFFYRRDRGISLQIKPANSKSYLFFYDGAPVFYCSRN